METENKFMVGVSRDHIEFLLPLPRKLTKSDALNLAAYIVALADEKDEFPALLEAVQNT